MNHRIQNADECTTDTSTPLLLQIKLLKENLMDIGMYLLEIGEGLQDQRIDAAAVDQSVCQNALELLRQATTLLEPYHIVDND